MRSRGIIRRRGIRVPMLTTLRIATPISMAVSLPISLSISWAVAVILTIHTAAEQRRDTECEDGRDGGAAKAEG